MLRLRTTTALSVLLLAAGITGTHWLSGLTAGQHDALVEVARNPVTSRPHALPIPRRTLARRLRVPTQRPPSTAPALASAALALAPPLQPLDMPAAATPYARLRGHLDGSLVLRVRVDGNGAVRSATVLLPSGDPLLDAHALATVDGWHFAVPPGHPNGFSGDLPMRFHSATSR